MTTSYGSSFYSYFYSAVVAEIEDVATIAVVKTMDVDASTINKLYLSWKGGNDMPENRGCGCGFGGDCCWIIILFILIICCCGNNNGCC